MTGIEEFPPAVEDARANARLNDITNCRFLCGSTEQKIAALHRADAVVLDPPRQGAAPGVIKALAGLKPSRIAYLSCNPSTLARDAARLVDQGYELKKLYLGDMFPHTYHIELLALFLPGGK
jgi:23S rRNA (uracil1939-C5)-methyltransferase